MEPLSRVLTRIAPALTPALVIRRAALLRNFVTMQAMCDAAGVRLRAHGKMHKCPELGRLQVEHGAVGLCCQTIGEAEAFRAGGIADLLVTAPLAPWAIPRLVRLASGGRIGVVADEPAQVTLLDRAASDAGVMLDVLIDVDLGQHRAGCAPNMAVDLARRIDAGVSLRFAGVQAYLGHIQHIGDAGERRRAGAAGAALLRALVTDLRAAGLAPAVVTGGGTGSITDDLAAGVYTEVQCGSYALMDAEYGACDGPGGTAWPFEPALFIAATVVSAQHTAFVTVDAGLKAVAVDGPPPVVVAGAAPGSVWRSMGDEHGAIIHPDHRARLAAATGPLDHARLVDAIDADNLMVASPAYGDRVWLQPGHCDPTINLYDAFLVADEDGTIERWPITAQRTTP